MNLKNKFVPRINVVLVNRFNNEIVECDIINEDEIEGLEDIFIKQGM